ncbi:tRNA (adenine(37)-N6)-methyltransferase isoform X1 [Acipenser ruthenus]|uniref:tRNA (adenine(37)-N6)-methyltransferase isoform X1 n=1 Tax=Acipenser ruthenus TaxID=7906 RepID=UPI00274278DC|nr:tRNA (adenine(37)-N6)-methyltransferase isoform X1 [Acipenser ruthenus]
MEMSKINFPTSTDCDHRVQKLQQQVSVMRKEIKNLRQHADSAVREQRKSLAALQSVVASMKEDGLLKDVKADSLPTGRTVTSQALEKGVIQTAPIGYIESCFSSKNGTPRQPTICSLSRAVLKINKSIFNNPEHSLIGLDQYSHVWIIFVFHKNGHVSCKAKVKPPRLNGVKTGVFSTRTPHRPNAIGLTLAKLEIIKGDTVYLSGIDMIQGTPVLDIKPYIPDYDSPKGRRNQLDTEESANQDQAEPAAVVNDSEKKNTMKRDVLSGNLAIPKITVGLTEEEKYLTDNTYFESQITVLADKNASCDPEVDAIYQTPNEQKMLSALAEVKSYISQSGAFSEASVENTATQSYCATADPCKDEPNKCNEHVVYDEASNTTIASWVRASPVTSLEVRFTPHAERDLNAFEPQYQAELGKPVFRYLKSADEAKAAIKGVLSADPRSVYRRTRCRDQLFYFTLDTAHITCWFGEGFAEVLRIKAVDN